MPHGAGRAELCPMELGGLQALSCAPWSWKGCMLCKVSAVLFWAMARSWQPLQIPSSPHVLP